jgi:hypothetical protein
VSPTTAVRGELWEGILPGVLRNLYVGRRTGVLSFARGEERCGVRFRVGNILSAETSVRGRHLGEMLVRRGRLSPADLKRAFGFMLRDHKRLGTVLIGLGHLDVAGLEEAVAAHAHEVLTYVFSWTEGSYEFTDEPVQKVLDGDITLRLSTGELILQAARGVRDPDVVRYNLGDIDRVLALSSDPLLRYQRISLGPVDGYVLSRVDGTLSAREIVQITPLPAEEVQRSLFGLLSTGVVEFVGDETKARLPVDERLWRTPAAPPALPHVAAGEPSPGSVPTSRPVAPEARETPEMPPPSAADAEPGAREEPTSVADGPPALGAGPSATLEAPTRPEEPPPTEIWPSLSELRPPGDATDEPPPTEVWPSLAELGTSLPLGDSSTTQRMAPVDTRRLEILEAHEGLGARTHFEILGVPRDATEAQVREAYFRLAKRFHPDVHHDEALSDLRDKLEEVFARLGEAYEVLCNPRIRASYERDLARGKAGRSPDTCSRAPGPTPSRPRRRSAWARKAWLRSGTGRPFGCSSRPS